MANRISQILKYLLLTVFLFELVVPVWASDCSVPNSSNEEVQFTLPTQNLFSPLLIEELNENEEEEEGDKSESFDHPGITIQGQHMSCTHQIEEASFIRSFQKFTSLPKLYSVQCKLVI